MIPELTIRIAPLGEVRGVLAASHARALLLINEDAELEEARRIAAWGREVMNEVGEGGFMGVYGE